MFHAKMHDEDDDELPRFDEEGQEQPTEILEEVEEVIVEEEPGEEVEGAAEPAPRKSAPARKAKKAKKAGPKKKAKAKRKAKKARPKKKARAKKGGRRKKR
jgi:hypothetical protein